MKYPSVWVTELSTGEIVAAIVNWGSKPFFNFKFNLPDIGISPLTDDSITVRDLYLKEDIGAYADLQNLTGITIEEIPAHGIKLYKFTTKSGGEEDQEVMTEDIENVEFIQ